MALRWTAFIALLLSAVAGVFLCLMLFGVSFMAFDAPQSDRLWWPYLLVAGSFVLLIGVGFLLIKGLSLMRSGQTGPAFACIAVPAIVPLVFLLVAKFT